MTEATSVFLPGLFAAFGHVATDVRKATVQCIVAVYEKCGDGFLPKLAALTLSQQKLVSIYINRHLGKPDGSGAKPR